jgi:hypothetical protein
MNIEAELPGDFDEMSDGEKVAELKQLKQELDTGSDAGAIKERIIEELIRNYRD